LKIEARQNPKYPRSKFKGKFEVAGFKLGMSHKEFIDHLTEFAQKPGHYKAKPLKLIKNFVSQDFEGQGLVKTKRNEYGIVDGKEHWEKYWDFLEIAGTFSGDKLAELWLYTTEQD